jgi:radical SAM superfamily enzyme YgiQ (UPF0313 family)
VVSLKILLMTPPMIQLNTPYPATAYLTGFLRSRGCDVVQSDPAILLATRLFSRKGLTDIFKQMQPVKSANASGYLKFFTANISSYLSVIEPTISFLQGKDPTLALRIVGRNFLPEGPSYRTLEQWSQFEDPDLEWAFGSLGVQDKAKYLASLMIDDLGCVLRDGIDEKFSLSRYGERLAASVASFDPLDRELEQSNSLIDQYLFEIIKDLMAQTKPQVVGLTVPFPGNLYGALRIAKTVKQLAPGTTVVLGGGYVNTELRELSEAKLFKYVDYVTLDDGEKPFVRILDYLSGKIPESGLLRTFMKKGADVRFVSDPQETDIPHRETGNPTYDGIDLSSYLQICEMLNPMHRIWSDGRWNKLTLAHGCYWSQCSFCDTSLDYISRYQEADIDVLIGRIRSLITETGQTGFHFVDEAAPPKILFALAQRLIDEGIAITWWGNLRFEKSFTPKTVALLAKSGCIAVTGGLEVASNRLLKLMNKGVTVEQVARVTHAFSEAGILVHAYLMYGFPTQTEQETIDTLERVRLLFKAGCIQSAFWHRFAATVHSPVGKNPSKFGIEIIPRPSDCFSQNDLDFHDPVGCDHDRLGIGLRKALYNFMLGIGLDEPLRFWFDHKIPKAQVPKDFITSALERT